MARTGGRILVDQLALHGVDLVFGVPGESYLEILDALVDTPSIRYVTCRHEGGAANMAEAYGKLAGRPGVCMVTRGPGATHASVGIHTAFQDGTPLILLVGQIPREQLGREAFQELDYPAVFGSMTKWVAQLDRVEDVPDAIARAFEIAASDRPGPVVLALPEDMLVETGEATDARPVVVRRAGPTTAELERVRELLAEAERPLTILGGQPWDVQAHAAATAWFADSGLPVAAAWRCQDVIDNLSASYAGHLGIGADPRLTARLRDADTLLVVGTRLGDIETAGYRTIVPPGDGRTLIHVNPAAHELGRVYEPTLGIVSSGPSFVAALAETPPLDRTDGRMEAAHADFLANLEGRPLPGAIDPTAAIKHIAELAPDDAILTNGAGNFTVWAHRFWTFRRYRTQLAPASGAMAYGLPAAIAAKLVHPERLVICIAGDGDLLMSISELATAVQQNAAIVVVVFDNGMLGTIRMHQERLHPGRVSATDLRNPDFVALARSFGAYAERVETTADVGGAFTPGCACGPTCSASPLARPRGADAAGDAERDPRVREVARRLKTAVIAADGPDGNTMRSPRSHRRDYSKAHFALTMRVMGGRRLRSVGFAALLALVLAVPALARNAEVVRAGGVSLTIPDGWSKINPASSDTVDPRTLLVVGTRGARPLVNPDCQVAAYKVPADGAVVVVIGWRDSIGGPRQLDLKLRRNTFECFDGRGAASQITRGGRDYQVSVMVGDRADANTAAAALAVGRSFAVVR